MTRLLSLLRALPASAWLTAGGVALAIGWWQHHNADLREQGRREVLTHQLDSTNAVLATKIRQDSLILAKAATQATRDSLTLVASRAAVRAAAGRTDSALTLLGAEHDRANRVLADTGATVTQVKDQLRTVVAGVVRDSAAFAVERAAWATDSTKANLRILALQGEVDGLKAANARLAEHDRTTARQLAMLKEAQPSVVGNVVRVAVGIGSGYLLGRFKK